MNRRFLLTVALATAACDGGAGARTSVIVHDSSGITVATSSAPAWSPGAGWSVDSTPLFSVGDGERRGDPLLINVRAARFTSTGDIVVVTGDDNQLRWIDPRGTVTATHGGKSDGPGLFRDLAYVGMVGDSVAVWDEGQKQVSLVTPESGIVRTFSLNGGGKDGPEFGYSPVGLLGSKAIVLAGRRGARSREQGGLRRDSIPLATASMTGAISGPFTTVPGAETVVVSTDQFVTMVPRPFGAQTALTVAGDEVLVTMGDQDEVRRYLPSTGLRRIDRLDRPRRLISPAEIDQQGQRLGAQTSQLPKPVAAAILGAMLSAGIPTVYPTFDRILTDAEGNAWLREDIGGERPLTEARTWVVLDRRGGWLGRVVTPAHFDVHQILRDRMLGVLHAANGGEIVQVLKLRR